MFCKYLSTKLQCIIFYIQLKGDPCCTTGQNKIDSTNGYRGISNT